MGQSTYPHGFNGDLVVRGIPVVNSYSKSAWWVDSNGSNNGDGTFKRPFTSIETAINSGKVVAGDHVHCKAGHVETVTAAAGLDLDVAGVTIFFHGQGSNRAQITFTTAVGADMDIDAANITLVNPLFVSGIDALTGPIDVNSADFTIINGEWRDAAAMAATDCIVADASADRMTIDGWRFIPSTTGTQKQSNIQVAGANDVKLRNIDIFGDFATGAIENGTAWVNALLENVRINNTNASPTVGILLQATSTGSMRNVHIRVASGVTYVTANNDMEFFECWGTGTDATQAERIGTALATGIDGVVGEVADAAATGAVTATDTLMAYTKQLVTQMGVEADTDPVSAVLSGTGGITTWKAATAPATGVSMSEVLRAIYDAVAADGAATTTVHSHLGRRVTKTGDVSTSTDALFTVTGKNLITLIVGEVTSVIATTTSLQLITSSSSIVLGASTDIISDILGTLYLVTGDPDDTLNAAHTPNVDIAFSKTGVMAPMLMNDDGIVQSINGAGTGLIQWDLYYIPLEAGASVTSAA